MTPILHRSLQSPYAQKVMAMMGYLDQNYQSVLAPKGMPRPIQSALVGPYARRIPVLQIGADLYCDSELINHILASRAGRSELHAYANPDRAREWIARIETEGAFAMLGAFGPWELICGYFRNMPPQHAFKFVADRAKLARKLEVPGKGLTRAEKDNLARIWLGALDAQLSKHAFLLSDVAPTSVDFTAYTMIWYHQSINGLARAQKRPHLLDWFERMQAFGIGSMTEVSGAKALDIATRATPAPIPEQMLQSERIGQVIHFQNGGFQPTMNQPVEGTLVGEDDRSLILYRQSADLGALHVHFPKLWY